ncbi:hypothetical protein HHL17_26060 [Chitinophaga sp. G-6-1-13]|uniref:Uncharacterized protein n=1 Tax=Chitinophaga fulva TaxID=2728842 RepID=A0A848GTL4_9BACT|nr:hypothetical protein [Chitinophaga fulva]NML40689.1 hypothetical protein [Chitinophaga fulva]
MKQILSLVAFLFVLNACTNLDRPLDIPDIVRISKTREHQQIPGTRIFMVIPKGYTVSGTTISKADGADIMLMESRGRALDKNKDMVPVPKESRAAVTFFQKNFMLNGYQANIIYGKVRKEKEEKINLVTGDDSFIMVALCKIPENNTVDRDEIITALKTAIVDKSVELDYDALKNYSLDFSHSVFKMNKNAAGIFYYTVDGKGDAVNNFVTTMGQLPAMPRVEDMKNCARGLAKQIVAKMVVKTGEEKVISIRGKPAYEITMKAELGGISQNVYLLILGNDKSAVYYLGYINDDQPALWKECKQLAQTLQLK